MRIATLMLSGLLALSACTNDTEAPDNQTAIPSTDPSDPTVDPTAEPSPELEALIADIQFDAVEAPGLMHGRWELRRGDEVVATLRFRQEENGTDLDGLWIMTDEEGEQSVGRLHSAAKMKDGQVAAHWDVDGAGVRYRYGISDTKVLEDGRIRVRLAEQRTGRVSDAMLVRVPN